ncbi:MAG: hypothetical protein GY696_23740 [Gammaproteobacteria bacterium]|nr:hypothetical protein [Gammaproteobacteria bacterium]
MTSLKSPPPTLATPLVWGWFSENLGGVVGRVEPPPQLEVCLPQENLEKMNSLSCALSVVFYRSAPRASSSGSTANANKATFTAI